MKREKIFAAVIVGISITIAFASYSRAACQKEQREYEQADDSNVELKHHLRWEYSGCLANRGAEIDTRCDQMRDDPSISSSEFFQCRRKANEMYLAAAKVSGDKRDEADALAGLESARLGEMSGEVVPDGCEGPNHDRCMNDKDTAEANARAERGEPEPIGAKEPPPNDHKVGGFPARNQ